MSFVAWLAWAALTWCPTTNVVRILGYGQVARAVESVTSDPDDGALLMAIGSLESGYAPTAKGKLGERGVWQLMPPVACKLPYDLVCEARVALSRVRELGMCGYTGEASLDSSECPLAHNRLDRAAVWVALHPFTAPLPELAAR